VIARFVAGVLALLVLASCAEQEQAPQVVDISWLSMKAANIRGWPDSLSEWNLLAVADHKLVPQQGVEPYQLNTPLFSDYALKFRTLWLPETSSLTVNAGGLLGFPVGAVLSKTFYYQSDNVRSAKPVLAQQSSRVELSEVPLGANRLIETRLLVNTRYGWVGLPYIWNNEQTDATLEIAGGRVPLSLKRAEGPALEFSYGVPNILECSSCHSPNHSEKAILPIGPTLANLNISSPYPGNGQIGRFVERKWLPDGLELGPAIARWDDSGSPIEDRAKAYLQVNCAHCHNPVGPADTSGLYLNHDNHVGLSYGVCKPPVAAGKGSGGRLVDVFPGAPSQSILSYRLHSVDPSEMMPEIGRTVAHSEGVKLIDDWITKLPGNCKTISQ
jgi:uncharacterized repeat protein (TIGR03806 family)